MLTMEPANGFEPLTCAFRVRLREISRSPWTLRSLKTRIEPSLRRRMGIPKNPDRGERAPRVPQGSTLGLDVRSWLVSERNV